MTFTSHTTLYLPLITVRVLHGHWLDEGQTAFAGLSAAQQQVKLLHYDFSSLMSVQPDAETAEIMKRKGMILRQNQIGFWLLCKAKSDGSPAGELLSGDSFRFWLMPRNSFWLLASDLPAEGLPLINGVPAYYSLNNLNSQTFPFLGLSQDGFVGPGDRIDQQQSSFAPGPAGAFARLEFQVGNSTHPFGLLDNQNKLRHTPETGFEIRFRPRTSTWKYHKNGSIQYQSLQQLPLTQGKIDPVVTNNGSLRLPNPALSQLVSDDQNPSQMISHIYLQTS